MAFSKQTLIMMRNMLVLRSVEGLTALRTRLTFVGALLSLPDVLIPGRWRMSGPRWSERARAVPGSALFQAFWDSADVSNSGDRMADPACGGFIGPCRRAAPHRSCSPSPTALGLWLGPRSAAAGPPAPPPEGAQNLTSLQFFWFITRFFNVRSCTSIFEKLTKDHFIVI